MMQGRVVDLDTDLALSAARLSAAFKLPMADSVMLSAAQKHGATLWTQDADLKDIPGVEYIAKS
jgi:predicted nucleic acid-binding protein